MYATDYYSAMKKKAILPSVTTWMGLEGMMLSKVSQSEENTSHMISLTGETWKLSGQIRRTDRRLPERGWGRTEREKVSEGTNRQLQNRVWGCSTQHGD